MQGSLRFITIFYFLILLNFIDIAIVSATQLKLHKSKERYLNNTIDFQTHENINETTIFNGTLKEKSIEMIKTNDSSNNLLNSSLKDHIEMIQPNISPKKELKGKITIEEDLSNCNTSDILAFKNYLTFAQLSKGLNTFKNVSYTAFGNISKQLGQNEFNYLLLVLALVLLISLILIFFLNQKNESKMSQLFNGKFFQGKQAKNNDNKILLKGRLIHRPANQYHYLLEKNEDHSVLSNESDENLPPGFDDIEESKFNLDFPNFLNNQQSQSRTSNFLSDMQFGKIFNNNNATNDDSKIKNFNNIDDLFANTLIPIEQKNADEVQLLVAPGYQQIIKEAKNNAFITNLEQIKEEIIGSHDENNFNGNEQMSIRDQKQEKISYLLQNHICEETIITRCSIPVDFKFKNKIKK